MTVVAQRNGVRVVAFNKCGHSSIINTFIQHRRGFVNPEPATIPSNQVNTDPDALVKALRSQSDSIVDWPDPHLLIAVIRNPVHRALSAYQHFIIRKERYKFTELGFSRLDIFRNFVNHMRTVDLTADPHLAPYTPDLLKMGGDRYTTALLPLELINEAWPIAISNAGLDDVPLEVWHKNAGGYDSELYLHPNQVEILEELYSQDYKLWQAVYDETRASLPAICYKTPEELVLLANQ